MALWCRDLPVRDIAIGTVPKPVTLVVPYYMNPDFFAQQVAGWRAWPCALSPYVEVIVVDDGSPRPAVAPIQPLPVAFRLFRIAVDRRWNWLAARNIGAHHARAGWLLLTDMDHVVTLPTLMAAVYGQHDPATIYAFTRREHTGEPIAPHSASFLLSRDLFWTIGGYDETLAGYYGTDGDFRRRALSYAPIVVQANATLVRHEFVADASTTRYLRKQPEDATVHTLIAARSSAWRPKTLSFPYAEVTAEGGCA